jgi:hypothetical protein
MARTGVAGRGAGEVTYTVEMQWGGQWRPVNSGLRSEKEAVRCARTAVADQDEPTPFRVRASDGTITWTWEDDR